MLQSVGVLLNSADKKKSLKTINSIEYILSFWLAERICRVWILFLYWSFASQKSEKS